MVIKQILFFILICSAVHTYASKPEPIYAGTVGKNLTTLREVAERINLLDPINGYILTVPNFIQLTKDDFYRFLAGIPHENKEQKKQAKKTESMLDHLQSLWRAFTASLKKDRLTAQSEEILEKIRLALDDAFKHSLTYNQQTPFARFLKTAIQNNMSLIVRDSLDTAFTCNAKSIFPVKPTELHRALAATLKSYYYPETIQELLGANALPTQLYLAATVQSFISHHDMEHPIASGISCSYDMVTGDEHFVTIEAMQHHAKELKDPAVTCDRYYVYHNVMYPIIVKKPSCFIPDLEMSVITKRDNSTHKQTCSSLEPSAVTALAQATQLISKEYGKRICLTFIKHEKTIYLLQIDMPTCTQETPAKYIDPAYVRKARKQDAVPIKAIKPFNSFIVIKHPDQLLFAQDLKQLRDQLLTVSSDRTIVAACIEQDPSPWAKELKWFEQSTLALCYTPKTEHIKNWIQEKQLPLVIDPQQKLMFPFKRKKGFCTLFQTVNQGINERPQEEHLSLLNSFLRPINPEERKQLSPKEFYGGVKLDQIIELIKHEKAEIAMRALRTILYRLENRIKLHALTEQEKGISPDTEKTARNKLLYAYAERICYELHTLLQSAGTTDSDTLARLFLANMLQNIISQQPQDNMIDTFSFVSLGL